MKSIVLVAVTAMALPSCQKNEIPAPEKQDVLFTINAGVQTKTHIEETIEGGQTIYKPKWDGNEELGLLFAVPNKDTEAKDVVKLTNAEVGDIASFKGTVTVDATEGTFYAFYPASAFNRGYAEGDARLDLKNVQKPTATSFDPTCDILVAKPYDYEVVDGEVVANGLQFTRVMSVLRIDLNSEFADVQNEFVESISFTAGDVEITGYARIFLGNPEFGKWASNGTQWRTVTANYDSEIVSINGESNSVYLVIAPVTIPENKDLTFEIKTKNYNISKTLKSPEMNFTAGNLSKINLTIKEENCEKIDMAVDYSDEYLIVNKVLTKAASKWTNGNNLPAVDLETENGVVYEADNLADCKMTITKVTEGDNAGKYTIQDAAGMYLYAAGGTEKNYLKGQATASYWTIEEKDGNYVITSTVANCTHNLLRYNSQNNLFSCYASGQNDITLYKYSDIKVDTTPKISVTSTSYSASAADTSVEIPYTVKNIANAITATVADGATMANVNATVADGKVTVTFDANTESTEKAATIVLSYEGAESVNVTVTQAAKPAEGGDVEVGWVSTSFTDLKDGDQVVIVGTKSSKHYAMSDDKGTSNPPLPVEVTISGNKLASEPATNIVWYVGVDGGNCIFYADAANGTKWLYCTSSNNGVRVGTNTSKTFAFENNYLKHVGTSRYLGIYNTQDWRCYTSVNDNIKGQTFTFYVKKGSSEGGETPEPEEPEQPVLSPRNLAFSATTANATVGQAFTAPTLSGVTTDVTYSSSNTSVATVNASTGAITLVAAGTTTITANAPETIEYEAGTASYTINVSEAVTEPEQPGGGEQVSKSYVEMFSSYKNTGTTNSTKVSISGDACSWTGVGVTTAYWSNFTWGSYSSGVSFLKPGSADAVYLESETLSGGITNLSIAAAANSGSAKIKVSVINVDNNNSETVLGTVNITSKKTKFTGSWKVTGVSGNYKIKIYNNTTAAYVNVTDIQWNNN